MNNRIKLLAEQAGIHEWPEYKPDVIKVLSEKQLCEFADLIVLETLAQVNRNMELPWIEGEAKIKQHFGVEK